MTKAAFLLNEKSVKPANCYYYRFAPDISGEDHPGTFHSVDLWFFFETLANAGGHLLAGIMIYLDKCVIIGRILSNTVIQMEQMRMTERFFQNGIRIRKMTGQKWYLLHKVQNPEMKKIQS